MRSTYQIVMIGSAIMRSVWSSSASSAAVSSATYAECTAAVRFACSRFVRSAVRGVDELRRRASIAVYAASTAAARASVVIRMTNISSTDVAKPTARPLSRIFVDVIGPETSSPAVVPTTHPGSTSWRVC